MGIKSASNKGQKCTKEMFKASFFEFNLTLIKILQIENIRNPHFECIYFRHEWA